MHQKRFIKIFWDNTIMNYATCVMPLQLNHRVDLEGILICDKLEALKTKHGP